MGTKGLPERQYQTIQEFADEIGTTVPAVMHYITLGLIHPAAYLDCKMQGSIVTFDIEENGQIVPRSLPEHPDGRKIEPTHETGIFYLIGQVTGANEMAWVFASRELFLAELQDQKAFWYQLPQGLQTLGLEKLLVTFEEKRRFISKHLKLDVRVRPAGAYDIFDEDQPRYPRLLDLAIQAWASAEKDHSNDSPKNKMKKWLENNYPELKATNVEDITKIANWVPGGGRPKT